MRTVQTMIFILVNNTSPIRQLQIGAEQAVQVLKTNAPSFGFLQRFHIFFTRLIVVKFIHAEYDASLSGKRGGDFLTVYQPIRARDAPLNKVSGSRTFPLLYQQVTFGEAERCQAGTKFTLGFGRKRYKGVYML